MQPSTDPHKRALTGSPALGTPAPGTAPVAHTGPSRVTDADGASGVVRPGAHIPALDGVRGLAIALVMASHFSWRAVPGGTLDRIVLHTAWSGWIGVDLFFVLSGFLITGILLDARGKPHYFRNFYVRRTLRIFPLYYAVLFAVLIVPLLLRAGMRDAEWYRTVALHAPWLWTYTSNVPLAIHDSWDVAGVLGHFWTLAVEEQFYIIWPAVVWLCPHRRLQRLCIAIIVMALAVRYGLRSMDRTLAGYVLMPARADAFAIGAWLAAAVRSGIDIRRLHRAAWLVLSVTAAGVTLMFLRRHPLREWAADVQLLGYLLLALGFAALIALALDSQGGRTIVGRVFRNAGLRFLGKYSYAMYCVHPLVKHALRNVGPGLTVNSFPRVAGSILPGVVLYSAIAFTLTTAIALASWHLLEKRFLRLKDRFTV